MYLYKFHYFNFSYFILFSLATNFSSCTHQAKTIVPKNVEEIEVNTIDSVLDFSKHDTIEISATLLNEIHRKYANVAGQIFQSDLLNFKSQIIDSSALIIAIDNRSAFKDLRKLKVELTNNLKDIIVKGSDFDTGLIMELNTLKDLITMDNLLPDISGGTFSSILLKVLQKANFIEKYNSVLAKEDEMSNYFIINEQPIYINKFHVREKQFVAKNQLLYEYLDYSKELFYEIRVTDSDGIVDVLDSKNRSIKKYKINGNKIVVTIPFSSSNLEINSFKLIYDKHLMS